MGAHARFQKVSTLGQVNGGGVGGHSYRYQESESAYCALDFAHRQILAFNIFRQEATFCLILIS